MRRRMDAPVIPDPGQEAPWLSCGVRQAVPEKDRRLRVNEAPKEWAELLEKYPGQPWRIIFPDLDWPVPDPDA